MELKIDYTLTSKKPKSHIITLICTAISRPDKKPSNWIYNETIKTNKWVNKVLIRAQFALGKLDKNWIDYTIKTIEIFFFSHFISKSFQICFQFYHMWANLRDFCAMQQIAWANSNIKPHRMGGRNCIFFCSYYLLQSIPFNLLL